MSGICSPSAAALSGRPGGLDGLGWLIVTAAWMVSGGAVSVARAAETLEIVASWPLDFATHHVQGLCVDQDSFWLSAVDRTTRTGWVWRVARGSGEPAATREVTLGNQYHPGGIQLGGGALWVPVAEYRPTSSTTVLALDPATLQTQASFRVDDHLGAIAVDERGGLIAANWDARTLYRLDKTGQIAGRLANPAGVAYQDLAWHDDRLWAAGFDRKEKSAVVDVLALGDDEARLERRIRALQAPESGPANLCREGFAPWGGGLYFLPDDGPGSRIYHCLLRGRPADDSR